MTTAIEWTDETWNPVRGCSVVSEGCRNCYAMKQAHRFSGEGMPYEGLTELGPQGPRWTGAVRLVPEVLDAPLHWKKPRRIFVNSMSDLFHEDVPNDFIGAVFGVMAASPQHTFQVLTKRPERMCRWFAWVEKQRGPLTVSLVKLGGAWPKADEYSSESVLCEYSASEHYGVTIPKQSWAAWPLPNVWLGVSVEHQQTADERIPILLQTPAAVRFVSAEPLLGPVDLSIYLTKHPSTAFLAGKITAEMPDWTRIGSTALDWVIAGGESGPGARPCDVAWIRSIVEQCKAAAVPCFVKQLGSRPFDGYDGGPIRYGDTTIDIGEKKMWMELKDKKGGDPAEWPADLRVREMPK